MPGATADGDAFYVVDRRYFIPTILTQGPWDPGAQHGGPVAGLLATVVEATPSLVPMQIARLTVDLLRPVPLEPLDTERHVVREGKRIEVVEVLLLCGTDLVARCSALRIRIGDDVSAGAPAADLPDDRAGAALAGPEAAAIPDLPTSYVAGIRRGVEMRVLRPESPTGRSALWLRIGVPLLAGHDTSPIARLAIASDFASLAGLPGIGRRFVAINADINLHVLRPPTGEWIAVEGSTAFAATGVGQSTAVLSDRAGRVASISCAQVVDARPDR